MALEILKYRPDDESQRPNARDLTEAGCGDLPTIEHLLGNLRFRKLLLENGLNFHRCLQSASILSGHRGGYRLAYTGVCSSSSVNHDKAEEDATATSNSINNVLQRTSGAEGCQSARKR